MGLCCEKNILFSEEMCSYVVTIFEMMYYIHITQKMDPKVCVSFNALQLAKFMKIKITNFANYCNIANFVN